MTHLRSARSANSLPQGRCGRRNSALGDAVRARAWGKAMCAARDMGEAARGGRTFKQSLQGWLALA
jgi:hypothetical protein